MLLGLCFSIFALVDASTHFSRIGPVSNGYIAPIIEPQRKHAKFPDRVKFSIGTDWSCQYQVMPVNILAHRSCRNNPVKRFTGGCERNTIFGYVIYPYFALDCTLLGSLNNVGN
jgi:hypothetical protein